ncbi:MAG: glycoside hydrolase family 97 protein [Muribaculaceae bacterium]|nr:glycoside hydrolase family 97 protein [Muribaculaceae bacterium]
MNSLLLTLAAGSVLSLSSPDKSHQIEIFQDLSPDSVYSLSYDVSFKGKPMVAKGRLGLNLDNISWEKALALGKRKLRQPKVWMDLLEVDSVTYSSRDTVWHPLYGERSTVKDHWNGATLHLSRKDASKYRLDVEVRAYDEGIAFRYFFPEHPQAVFHKITEDLTSYRLPDGTMVWATDWAQAPYRRVPVDSVTTASERALTIEFPEGHWGALTDADTDDWCLTKFVSGEPSTLNSVMYSPVDIVTYYATPWKVIMGADTPGQLLENNDIIQNLNPPCEIADAKDWVKPGTIMRETTLTTEGAIKTIDFCSEHNIPYMLFDWLWYVPCTSHDGDATKVIDKLDMKRVVDYGREKGVGVWLYVNQHALMKQQRELLPLLNEWGIKGVKSGFVQYASHRWATWLHDLVRYAAENKLLMNIHDEYRPSGFSRTYPNLLTQEGILGNEEFPDATHNVTLPFTRMINGAADYTICYYDKRITNTHAHQLAASVVYYTPLVTIFWYDKPQAYEGEPEISWFENLKTVWDDSKVISGHPGEHIVMARRNGNDWWVGAMTNNDGRHIDIPLDFLEEGASYTATLYTDDPKAPTKTKVKVAQKKVKKGKQLPLDLLPRGGAAIHISKI